MKKFICLLCLIASAAAGLAAAEEPKPAWTSPSAWFDSDGQSLVLRQDDLNVKVDPATGQALGPNDRPLAYSKGRPFNPGLMNAVIERPADLIGLDFLARLLFGNYTYYGLYASGTVASPDGSLLAVPSKAGISVKETLSGKTLREIAAPVHGFVEWQFVHQDWLLRVADGKATLYSVAGGEATPIELDAPVRGNGVFKRNGSFYLLSDKSLYKFDASSGKPVWSTAALKIAKGLLLTQSITALYEGKAGLLVGVSNDNYTQKYYDLTNYYLLDPASGAIVSGPIASREFYPLQRASNSNEVVGRVSEAGEGIFLVESFNVGIIDAKAGKQLWAGGRHSAFNVPYAAMELAQDRLARKYFPQVWFTDDTYAYCEQDGDYRAYRYKDRKNVANFKLGLPLATTKRFGDAVWLVGADFRRLAFKAVDAATFTDAGLTVKPLRVYGWDLTDQGLYYCVDSAVNRIDPELRTSKFDLAAELGKKPIETISVAPDGATAWLTTADSIAQYDFAQGKVVAKITWNPADFKFKDDEARNGAIVWQRGGSLFVSRSPAYGETLVPLQAFDLASGKLVWGTRVAPSPFAFFDQAKLVVVSTEKGSAALPYPAAE